MLVTPWGERDNLRTPEHQSGGGRSKKKHDFKEEGAH